MLIISHIGCLIYEIIYEQSVFIIINGLCLVINLMLIIFYKKLSFICEKASIISIITIYVISGLHIRDLNPIISKEFTQDNAIIQGYWLCLFHQLSLRHLTSFPYIFALDIGALIFRSILIQSFIKAFPGIFILHVLFDLSLLYTYYRKEVRGRTMYSDILSQKEGTSKFKSLMVNSLPESIIIMDMSLTKELFANKAFQKVYRSSEASPNFKNDLKRTFLIKESLETADSLPLLVSRLINETPVVCLWDFLHQGLRSKLFKEEVFIIYGSLIMPASQRSSVKRRIFEIKIFCFAWDNEDAIAVVFNEVTHRETILSLKLSDMSKDKVISSVSHELRTPLNGIQGMIQIMQKQAEDPQMQQFLTICKSSADLLLHIINSIIDLQFLTKNKLVLHKSEVNVRDLINEVGSLFVFQCEHKRLDLNLSIDEGGPETIITDKERLTQVLVHLASNAVKFTFKGGITIGAKRDPDNYQAIVFWVKDSGTGIKDIHKTTLFKMNGHVDTSSVGAQGAGLGLTISKELVMKLKATKDENVFEVNTAPGKGSNFSFSLPIDLDEAEKGVADRDDVCEIGQEYDLKNPREIITSRRFSNKKFDEREEEKFSNLEKAKFFSEIIKQKTQFDNEEDLEDVGEELYVDGNVSEFFSFSGPSLIAHYPTRPRYNTYKLIEGSSSGKFTFDDSPTLKSLLKITSPGIQDFRSRSQSFLSRDEKRAGKEGTNREEKFDNLSDISSLPFKINETNRKKIGTFTHTLDNSHILIRDIQSATSITSTPREHPERKRSRIVSRYLNRIGTKNYSQKSVLLVDDNSFNLLVAKHIIEDCGFQVITALTGLDAINIAKRTCQEGNKAFTLILMDLQMPVMDGFETTSILIKMMKSNEIPEMPIVALTANTTDADIDKCLQYGMISHLAKPLKTEDLDKVLISLENR